MTNNTPVPPIKVPAAPETTISKSGPNGIEALPNSETLNAAIPSTATQAAVVVAANVQEDPKASRIPEYQSAELKQLKVGAGAKSYQFPSAPCTIEFQYKGGRVTIPDGVYRTSDAKEIEELDKWVDAGNIYDYTGDITSPLQIPPKPIDPTAESN